MKLWIGFDIMGSNPFIWRKGAKIKEKEKEKRNININ
jgi:hypothetical protein